MRILLEFLTVILGALNFLVMILVAMSVAVIGWIGLYLAAKIPRPPSR
jgi:hypothetical protein